MNTQAMRELADYIEDKEVEMMYFNNGRSHLSAETVDECGSVGCLAGWYCSKNFDAFKQRNLAGFITETEFAAEGLGLTESQSGALFMPRGWEQKQTRIPRDKQRVKALKVLRGEIPLTSNWLVS